MNKETKESLMQIGELVKEEKHDAKQKYMRVKDACGIYVILSCGCCILGIFCGKKLATMIKL